MTPTSWLAARGYTGPLELLRQDDESALYRAWSDPSDGDRRAVLTLLPATERPLPGLLQRLAHEYELKDFLEDSWAVQPLELVREQGWMLLRLDSPAGMTLDRLIGGPMEIGLFLQLAVALARAAARLHQRGLVHKDIKPTHIVVDPGTRQVWLTGFGIASRLPRERQSAEPPEFVAGTLAYMAPEQTGRMNRSIDSRSDLYSLGVTLYEMLTGSLPFTASDPMEWVHCHIAKQPVPPTQRLANTPSVVSNVVMKLLAKTAEQRYQTATGLESDLRHCLIEWQSRGRIEVFPLGEHDTPDRLLIPEKLYGRAAEIRSLLDCFEQTVTYGTPRLVLVSGYSGIGKSSVVNELQKALVPPRGLFASGKFDQYKRDIPYSTLAQAFQGLVRELLSKNEAELRLWRKDLREALGPNGLLMLELVPELEHILGKQPPVPVLPPQDAQRRFQLVLRRFLGVFARPEHPLALFLDDLQWLDAATLDVLEELLGQADVQHLLLIGAYRDNEVDATHPLRRRLETLRRAGAAVDEIVLAPLTQADLEQLIVDCLRGRSEEVTALASLLYAKTAGNPFFAIQFLGSLADEGLLHFDHATARWCWDLERIRAKGYTDNVADLMIEKLRRLPWVVREALQRLACLGNKAEFSLLAMVNEDAEADVHADLREAVQAGLILQSEGAYGFLHDRVQEAAYSLIPEHLRAATHLRIGRLLAGRLARERHAEAIFELVNQLNRGAHLIYSAEERRRVAELNLAAAGRAKSSTAYRSALAYLTCGRQLLTEESWHSDYELIFAIEYNRAECELLTADMDAAEQRLTHLAQRAKSEHDMALVTRLRLTLYTTLDRSDRGVEVCLEYLRHGSSAWSAHPQSEQVLREYELIWARLGGRRIEALLELPLMTDPDVLDMLDVLAELVTPALFSDENLCSLVICRMVNLSLQHGNSDGSCFAYVWFAIIAGPRFDNYAAGSRFGRLGVDLVEKRGLQRFRARTLMSFGDIVLPWTSHVRTGRDLVRRAFDAANEAGDLTFAAYSRNHLVTNLLSAGEPLAEVQREAENGLTFARKVRFGLVIGQLTTQLAFVRTLRGLTPRFGTFDHEGLDELRFERDLTDNPVLAEVGCWYSVRKLQARFFAGEYGAALAASMRAQQLLWTSPSQFETAEFHFYSALARAASWDDAPAELKQQHFAALVAHQRQLEAWARHCPENFENRAALASAEIARIEGRELQAQQLYEQAIRSAHTYEFVHNAGLAYEIAARFYAARGYDKFARAYLREARYCYLRWGAEGKVRQLDKLYPNLRGELSTGAATSTIGTAAESLELATVIKLSNAMSGDTSQEKLIDTVMRLAIEHAGAERGLLILAQEDELRAVAEATASADRVSVDPRQASLIAANLPESVVHYVARAKENLLLQDASSEPAFAADEYIRRRRARSILCLALLKESRLIGVLYLENNLAPGIFTASRLVVLKLLAAEAAISLENLRLHDDQKRAETEARESERRYREVETALARANRIATLGQMSASIAHEINQPVAATVTYAEAALRFLNSPEPSLEEVRQALTRIAKVGRRAVEVVGRVRALVQKAPPRKDDFDINGAIREVISLSHADLEKSGVSMRSRFAPRLPSVQADRVQLQQVVLNLMMNAVEAMSHSPAEPRELRISTGHADGGEILVSVEDSGPGLDPGNPKDIFEPFFSTKPGGLGIGLSICRSIIEAHAGRLWTHPSELGGAAFSFILPAHRSDQTARS